MKKFISYAPVLALTALTAMLLLTGCTTQYDTLQEIPSYEQPTRTFNTTATLEVVPSGSPVVDKVFYEHLQQYQYNDIVSGTHYKGTTTNPVKIVIPLNWHMVSYKCQDGVYIESRIIVMVRLPGEYTEQGLVYPKPRYFQAFAQKNVGENEITMADWQETLNQAMGNLFTIDKFRQALEP